MLPARPPAPSIDLVQWLAGSLADRPAPRVLVVVGFGDGAILNAIERIAPAARILAIEPDAAQSRRFLANPQAQRWQAEGRLLYLADPDYAGAEVAWRLFPANGGKPLILTHPELTRCDGLARAKEVLKRVLFGVEANAAARRRFAPRYLTNSIGNLPAMLRGSNLAALRGAYRGTPAVVVGAGPSLDRSLDGLRDRQRHALVIAADTALRPLLTAGVAPQLVVGMDPGAANLRHFLSLPECRDTWLVAESALDPKAPVLFEERTFWFRVANHEPWPWLNGMGIDAERLEVWGSVLTGALQVACLAGCDPIVIVGADLAYTDGRPYARGTTYEFDWAWYAGYGRPLRDTWEHLVTAARPIDALDLHGGQTRTTEVLQSYRDWTVAQAGRAGRRFINAGSGGILTGAAIEHLPLDEAIVNRADVPHVAQFATRMAPDSETSVVRHLSEVLRIAEEGDRERAPIQEWRDFSGDGFDFDTLQQALRGAAAALQPGHRVSRPESGWAAYLTQHVDHVRSSELSDASLRLHAGLNGLALAKTPSCANSNERAVLIEQAFVELTTLCGMLLREPADVQAVTNLPGYGQLAVALEYAWTDQQRWALQAFEALLGKAWEPAARIEPSPFQNRHVRHRLVPPNGSMSSELLARPANLRACRRLISEWLRCLSSLTGSDHGWTFELEALLVIQALLRSEAPPEQYERSAWISLLPGDGKRVDLPVGFSPPALARAFTGHLRPALDAPYTICRRKGGKADVALMLSATPPADNVVASPIVVASPRLLTEEGYSKSAVAYGTTSGAVHLPAGEKRSVTLGPDGAFVQHHTWPLPLLGELPYGAGGAVAWSDGLGDPSRPGYVMYRAAAGEPVTVEDLPIRPTVGAWWQGRLYFSCWPRSAGSWSGLASWAPGEGVKLEIASLPPLAGVHPTSEGLRLEPIGLEPTLRIERAKIDWGWLWQPGGALAPLRLSPAGAGSGVASSEEWTATAHFAADAIHLCSTDGRSHWLACYNPFKLAWVGGSLLVSTIERELFLFEHLRELLDNAR